MYCVVVKLSEATECSYHSPICTQCLLTQTEARRSTWSHHITLKQPPGASSGNKTSTDRPWRFARLSNHVIPPCHGGLMFGLSLTKLLTHTQSDRAMPPLVSDRQYLRNPRLGLISSPRADAEQKRLSLAWMLTRLLTQRNLANSSGLSSDADSDAHKDAEDKSAPR